MKNKILFKIVACIFALICMSATLPYAPNTTDWIGDNDCLKSIEYEVQVSTSKSIQASTTRNKRNFNDAIPVKQAKNRLEVCVDKYGNCRWDLRGNEALEQLTDQPGMEELIIALRQSAGDLPFDFRHYIEAQQNAGAIVSDLGNGTISVRKAPIRGVGDVITLIDIRKGLLLGINVFDAQKMLSSKVICQYRQSYGNFVLKTATFSSYRNTRDRSGILVKETITHFSNPIIN